MTQPAERSQDRLYQDLARSLLEELSSGRFPVGARLPAERELAATYTVSRPTVREAMIALEVQGLVEVRVGSGAYVRRLPGKEDIPGFNITAFELTEARLIFEGEAAALAACARFRGKEVAQILFTADTLSSLSHDPRGWGYRGRNAALEIGLAAARVM